MKRLVFILMLAALTLSCSTTPVAAQTRHDDLERKVNEMMDGMTLHQKVAQLFVIQIDRNNSEEEILVQDSLVRMGLGGVIIMRGPVKPFMKRANEMQSHSSIPLLFCTDAEWGAAMRFYEYLPYPRQLQLSKIPDAEPMLYQMGLNVARELSDLNIHVNFAPVADIAENPLDEEYSSQRNFSHGVQHVTSYADAYMRGLQDGGVSACGKHFPSHGDTRIDAHVEQPLFYYTREQMDSTYLVPFKRMIEDGVDFIMLGHHAVSGIDSTMIPMSISPKCVRDLLKGDLGFKGIVVTDALGMGGVANGRTPMEVMLAAYRAGVDMLLMPHNPIAGIKAIADSVSCGAFPLDELDARVHKVLMLKAEKGFFDKGFSRRTRHVAAKVRRARRRDSRLIEKMNRAIALADSAAVQSAAYDPTLVLDRGRDIEK